MATNNKNKTSQRRLTSSSSNKNGGLLDSKSANNIIGVVVISFGIIFGILSTINSVDGIASSFLSKSIHLCFGICSIVPPVFLIIYGISVLLNKNEKKRNLRLLIGLFILFLGISAFVALLKFSTTETKIFFEEYYLINGGGYIGNAIAWSLCTFFGKIISIVICIALIIIGLIFAGFSLFPLVDLIKSKRLKRHELNHEQNSNEQINPNIRLDKNGDIDLSQFKGMKPGKTQLITNLKSPLQSKERHREQAERRVPVSNLLNNMSAEDEQKAKTSSMTRKLKNDDIGEDISTKDIQNKEDNSAVVIEKCQQSPDNSAQPDENSEDGFALPSFAFLSKHKAKKTKKIEDDSLGEIALHLQQTLEEFGVMATVVGWVEGPTVTLFKVELPAGVRVNKVQNLNADLALALATSSVRIFAPIPGTNYVGIEVPNAERETVLLSDVLMDAKPGHPLQIALGRDVEGKPIIEDLAKMPHLLIGGTTGSGKSVSVNAMIMSILMRAKPSDVRFIMIDPKRVEFTPYNGIPHLYTPVVTEPKEASSALSWGVAEMERRLKIMSEVAARNITEYNNKIATGQLDDIKNDLGECKHTKLPYIVIIIDELADLMMSVGKEVEMSICRIAQLARAAGIHLIVATQRPSTNVVTGLIKSNITNRIAFNVASSIDSRVILDTTGAENLIGLGDMLLSKPELGKPLRIQGCYVSEKEISKVVEYVKAQSEPEYHAEILTTHTIGLSDTSPSGGSSEFSDLDPLFREAADLVVNSGVGSTSNLQRRLKVGYSRAGRIMDQLEDRGVVGPNRGSRPREVLVDSLELETLLAFESNN